MRAIDLALAHRGTSWYGDAELEYRMYRKGFSGYSTVFTRASTSDGERRFFPLGGIRETSGIKAVLALLEIYALTGDMLFQIGFQQSDNPEVWPDAATYTRIGTSSTTAGPTYSNDAYEDVSSLLTKQYVRFGVIVRNNSGSPAKTELAWVAGRFDTRGC